MEESEWKEERNRMLKLSNDEAHELTVECIEQALLALLSKKKLDEISITDITKRAGVSRTAFYKNYQSKEEVIRGIISSVFQEIMKVVQAQIDFAPNDKAGLWWVLFEVLKEKSQLVSMCFGADQGVSFLEYTTQLAVDNLKHLSNNLYYPYYIGGAIQNTIRLWIERGMQETPAEMAQILIEMDNIK